MFSWPGISPGRPIFTELTLGADAVIECATWGPAPPEAATIMLLHEGLGCVELWRNFPAELAKTTGCGVFTYSRLGYGRSSPITPPLPVTRMADEARDVLPQLIDIIAPETLYLVGHSDGGTIAAHYLAGDGHPALEAAVLMSAHFLCETSNVAAIRATCEAYESGDLRRRLAKYHDNVDGAFRGWAETWLDPAFADWDMRGEISKWRHPVLFIQGRDDPYGSERQAQAAAVSPLANIAWLDNCAHSPHLEQGARTLALIQDFIGKISKSLSDGG